MALSQKIISKGFIAAGLMNFTVLIWSRFFTNSVISKYDAVVMSNFGLLMIVIWGLAYISVAKRFENVKWLVAVFAIEKLIYGIIWMGWHTDNKVSNVFTEDTFAGIFFSIYGLNDWIFCLFFTTVFVTLLLRKN